MTLYKINKTSLTKSCCLPICFQLLLASDPVAASHSLCLLLMNLFFLGGWKSLSLPLPLFMSLSFSLTLSHPTSAGFQSKHRSYSPPQDDSLTPRQTYSSHFHYPSPSFLAPFLPSFPHTPNHRPSDHTVCLYTDAPFKLRPKMQIKPPRFSNSQIYQQTLLELYIQLWAPFKVQRRVITCI